MNRSYSKKRHIQEVNERLEVRHLLKEQIITNKISITTPVVTLDNQTYEGKAKTFIVNITVKNNISSTVIITEDMIGLDEGWSAPKQTIIPVGQEKNIPLTLILDPTNRNQRNYFYFMNKNKSIVLQSRIYLDNNEYDFSVTINFTSVVSNPMSTETKPSTIQAAPTPKKESIKSNVNPIQVGQQIPIYTDKNSQKLMGYVKVTKIIENPSSTTGLFTNSKFDAEIDVSVLPGFKFKFMDVIFRDFSFDGKSREETKESKENFTIYFSCQKEGLKIGNKETKFRYTGVVFSPDITEYFSKKICNKSVVSDKTDVKSQEETSSQSYYFAKDNKAVGPKTLQEIKNEIKLGTIRRETLVWKTGMPNWDKAENFLELKDSLGALPPQLPGG